MLWIAISYIEALCVGLVMLGLSYCMVIVYNLTGPFIT